MSSIKLTKTELRAQEGRLSQFQRYLPTLQLKKAMLQFEVASALSEVLILREEMLSSRGRIETFSSLLSAPAEWDFAAHVEVAHVNKRYENIAGIEIPLLDEVVFRDPEEFLFDTPAWSESAIESLRELVTVREKISVAEEKKRALEKELREVSIRVNLFEKILIPRARANIKKIRVFLGDQQLAVVAQAKTAKRKIRERLEAL